MQETKQVARNIFQTMRAGGMPERGAAIAAFPQLPPDSAVATAAIVMHEPTQVDSSLMSLNKVSSVVSAMGRRDTLVSKGMDQAQAQEVAQATFANVPPSSNVVDYDRVDQFLTDIRRWEASHVVEGALASNDVLRDIEMLGTVTQGLFGGSQQAAFGAVIGEQTKDWTERLWPKVDIREDDGTVQRKSVFMQSLKSALLGSTGVAANLVGNTTAGFGLREESKAAAEQLMNSEWREDLLTGQDVVEYLGASNFGLFPITPPARGTPEREAYDAAVKEYAAENYAALSDKWWSGAAMAGISLTGALGDVFFDPAIVASEVPAAAVKGMRVLGPLSSRARTAGAIANRTRRLDDTTEAVELASRWVDDVAGRFAKDPEKYQAQFDHAKDYLVRQKSRLDLFKQEAPPEAISISGAPKIRPEHAREVGEVYFGNPVKTRPENTRRFINKKMIAARQELRGLEKKLKTAEDPAKAVVPEVFTPEQLGESVPELRKAVEYAKRNFDEWTETSAWFRGRMESPAQRTASLFKQKQMLDVPYVNDDLPIRLGVHKNVILREIDNNIKRAVVQGVPEADILQWERTYDDVLQGRVTPVETVQRSKLAPEEVVRQDLREARIEVLAESPNIPLDLDTAADFTQVQQRIAFGPDNTERVMVAADILARGGEIDDVAYHGMPLDVYNTSRGLRPRPTSGTEGRSLKSLTQEVDGQVLPSRDMVSEAEWLGVDPVNTMFEAAKWQRSFYEKFGDHWQKGLHPETWNIRMAGMLNYIREPMRMLQSYDPRLYQRVHSALRAQEFEVTRMTEVFRRELQYLGVYTKVGDEFVHVPEKAKQFYNIMNLDPTSVEYDQALRGLTAVERRSVRRVRQELDFVANKLGLRESDRYIEGYIDHVLDPRWFEDGKMPPDWKGFLADARVFNPHLLRRRGVEGEFVEDLGMALDVYTRAASRKLHLEPLFEDMKVAADLHIQANPGSQWFTVYVNDMINSLQGKQSLLGQRLDLDMGVLNARLRASAKLNDDAMRLGGKMERVGQKVYDTGERMSKIPGLRKAGARVAGEGVRITEYGSNMSAHGIPRYVAGDAARTGLGITSLVYASVLGGSGRYFPMAVSTALATTASRKGIFNTVRGIMMMGTDEGRALAHAAGLERQWLQIMEEAAWTRMGKLAAEMPSFNGVTGVGPSITATENLIRGWTFHAVLGDMMRKMGYESWDEVARAGMANSFLDEGLRTTEEVNHLFGQLGKPPIFNRYSKSGAAAMTQFLSFIPKQTEELLAQAIKNPGHIGQYMMISGYLARVAGKAGLDISDYVGMGYLPGSPDDATSITFDTLNSLLSTTAEFANVAAGTGDPVKLSYYSQDLSRNLTNMIPLAMATQRITRTGEMLRTGKLYSGGELVRELDLGEFTWDDKRSIVENISNLPRALLSEQGPKFPTELMSVLTGLNSVTSRLERQAYTEVRGQEKRQAYRKLELANAMDQYVRDGESEAFNKALDLAINEGFVPRNIRTLVERSALEQMVPRLLRFNMKTEDNMINSTDTLMRDRFRYELLYGSERE